MYLDVPTTSPYGQPGAVDPGLFRSLGMAAEEALEMSPVGLLDLPRSALSAVSRAYLGKDLGEYLPGIDPIRGAGVRYLELEALRRGGSRLLDPDEANEKYGIGDLSFSAPVREDAARYMRARHLKELNRNQLRAYASQYGGTSRNLAMFAAAFGAQALDPVNFASMFVPIVGPGRAAATAGKVAWWQRGIVSLEQLGLTAGTFRARAAEGLIEGAVGGALMEPITAVQRKREGFDYGMGEFVAAVGFSAALGAGLHTSLYALGRAFGVTPKTAHLAEEVSTRQFMEGAAVRVADMLESERRGVKPAPARVEEGMAAEPARAAEAVVPGEEPSGTSPQTVPDLLDLSKIDPETITDPKARAALEVVNQKRAEVERLRAEIAAIEVPEKPKSQKKEFPEGIEKADPERVAEWKAQDKAYKAANRAQKRATEALAAADRTLKQQTSRARTELRKTQQPAQATRTEEPTGTSRTEEPDTPLLRQSAEAQARMRQQMEQPVTTTREALVGKPDQPISRNVEVESPEQQMADLAEEAMANRELNKAYMTADELLQMEQFENSTRLMEEMRRKLPEIAPCMKGKLNS